MPIDPSWTRIRAIIESEIGRDAYQAWIAPLRLVAIEGSVARFAVPTTFFGNWVARNYGDRLLHHLRQEGMEADRLGFDIQPARRPANPADQMQPETGRAERVETVAAAMPVPAAAALPAALPAAPAAAPSDGDLISSPLDRRFRFDRFVVGKPNELAHAAARRVAECGPVSFNPLFLYGGVGLGKTHLMHAIAWEIRDRHPELKVIYLSAENFMYQFVRALRERSTLEFKEIFRNVDVLMVDDVQFIGGKDSTQSEFFHTFNALVDQRKQLVISGDRNPGEMDGVDERIKSRLQWGLVVDLHPTDYELRLGILESKADAHLAEHPETKLETGVLEFLAHRISSNVRILEGALTRLFAFATLVGRRIDLDMTQECLTDILRSSDRKVTVDEIIRKVAEHYNLRITDLLSARRARAVARPRQVAMFLAKQLTLKSLPEIGRRFGGRDHTTVLHALRKIEELRLTDSSLADDIEMLRRALEG